VNLAITQEGQQSSKTPTWMRWVQCITFVVLYAVWLLPEVVGIPEATLVFEAAQGKCTDLSQHTSAESDSIFGRSA
jgi:hypothetical protein